MSRLDSTQNFKVLSESENRVGDILQQVYQAMTEKGYNPVNQIVGYIMSGDPTYITSHNNARSLIMKVERDELVEDVYKRQQCRRYGRGINSGSSLKSFL